VQLLALGNENTRLINNNNQLIVQYANEAVNIEIVNNSQYENEQKELMEEKVHKQKMYFLIPLGIFNFPTLNAYGEVVNLSAVVILSVVVAIFIGLIVIVRKSQKY